MYRHQNIDLRKLREDDLNLLFALKSESWGSTHRISILTMEDQVRWYKSLDPDVHCPKNLVLVASPVKSGERIGIFKIFNIDWVSRTADVAWDVFKSYRKKGYGKKLVSAGSSFCFNVFNLHRLNCEILDINVPSSKCAIHAGFKKEGVKRQSVIKYGRYTDSIVYGLLADEFCSNPENIDMIYNHPIYS